MSVSKITKNTAIKTNGMFDRKKGGAMDKFDSMKPGDVAVDIDSAYGGYYHYFSSIDQYAYISRKG